MSNPEQPSIYERSTTVRLFRWLFSWRGLRRMLIIMAWIVTVIALFYGEENWRGRRAWNKTRQELEARGEQLDFKAFIPKSIPDEQNFAATPFVKRWFDRDEKGRLLSNEARWEDDYSRIKSPPSTRPRRLVDLAGWAFAFQTGGGRRLKEAQDDPGRMDGVSRSNAAPAVLAGLKSSEAKLEELRTASQRPYSRYPVFYNLENPWGILLPHLATIKGACTRLQIKACAELALGRNHDALEDVKLVLYLTDSLHEEPFLISYLVRIACVQIAADAIWEGLAEHRWSDAELQFLQTRLQQYDFLPEIKRPLDSERAAAILTSDLLYRRKYHLSELVGEASGSSPSAMVANFFARIAPHGWYYFEQINYCKLYEMRGAYDTVGRRVFPAQIAAHSKELEHQISGGRLGRTLNGVLHHQLIAALLLPALENIPRRAATAQTAVDEALLACALERYRLANGQFPEKLEALVPRFVSTLPHDVISGGRYQYRRDQRSFVLYSVGWNEKDDGGTSGKVLFDDKFGDWVWDYWQN